MTFPFSVSVSLPTNHVQDQSLFYHYRHLVLWYHPEQSNFPKSAPPDESPKQHTLPRPNTTHTNTHCTLIWKPQDQNCRYYQWNENDLMLVDGMNEWTRRSKNPSIRNERTNQAIRRSTFLSTTVLFMHDAKLRIWFILWKVAHDKRTRLKNCRVRDLFINFFLSIRNIKNSHYWKIIVL